MDLTEHLELIKNMELEKAFEDYAQDMKCILNINGKGYTLRRDNFVRFVSKIFAGTEAENLEILVEENKKGYGVLTFSAEGVSDFVSYVCVAQDEEIKYITLLVHELQFEIALPETHKQKKTEARKMFYKHCAAMMSASANVITKDYDDKAVVITNMSKDICDGKEEIYSFCDTLMKSVFKILKSFRFYGFSKIKWRTTGIKDGLLLFVVDAKCFDMIMTESYWVKDGKIQFETSICKGGMLDCIRNL